jgi:hypothetical protein
LDIPFAASLSPGNYWIGLGRSTSTAGNGPTALSSASLALSFLGMSQFAQSFEIPGVSTNNASSAMLQNGLGFFANGAFAYSTNSINITNVSQNASNPTPYFEIIRQN